MRTKGILEPRDPSKADEWLSPDGYHVSWRRVWNGESWVEDLKAAGFPATQLSPKNPDLSNVGLEENEDGSEENEGENGEGASSPESETGAGNETSESTEVSNDEGKSDEQSVSSEVSDSDGQQEPDAGASSEERREREDVQPGRKGKHAKKQGKKR